MVIYFVLYSLKVSYVRTHSIPHGDSTLKHVGTSINKLLTVLCWYFRELY